MSSVTCGCCGETKAVVTVRKSLLIPSIDVPVCQSCADNKFEPRWCIIMAGRARGPEYVKYFINNHRYVGDDIKFSEVVV